MPVSYQEPSESGATFGAQTCLTPACKIENCLWLAPGLGFRCRCCFAWWWRWCTPGKGATTAGGGAAEGIWEAAPLEPKTVVLVPVPVRACSASSWRSTWSELTCLFSRFVCCCCLFSLLVLTLVVCCPLNTLRTGNKPPNTFQLLWAANVRIICG